VTSRELLAQIQIGEVPRKPVIAWGFSHPQADAVVLDTYADQGDSVTMVRVDSPLTKQAKRNLNLNHLLHSDPEAGNKVLDELVSETLEEGKNALASGADGVAYVIDGAYPGGSTPMQFGGYYLERDREILEQLSDANFNLVFIEGGEETYLDSVSDLAANAIGWRICESGFSKEMMRELRCGPVAGNDASADIHIAFSEQALQEFIRSQATAEVSA
jgi:hypothetical protein